MEYVPMQDRGLFSIRVLHAFHLMQLRPHTLLGTWCGCVFVGVVVLVCVWGVCLCVCVFVRVYRKLFCRCMLFQYLYVCMCQAGCVTVSWSTKVCVLVRTPSTRTRLLLSMPSARVMYTYVSVWNGSPTACAIYICTLILRMPPYDVCYFNV